MDIIKHHLYAKFRDINDEMSWLRSESSDIKSRLELKDQEKGRYESKIRALEKIINTNTCFQKPIAPATAALTSSTITPSTNRTTTVSRTPMQAPPVPSQSVSSVNTHNATNGGSSSSSAAETPSYNNPAHNRVNRLIADSRSSTVSGPNSSNSSSSSSSGVRIGSIANNAAFNRFQTPSKNSQPTTTTMLSRDGMPVANRKHQRRSKSVETWIDHKPPATPKIDTVMQPKMNGKKKSVSKLELKDTKNSSRYLLTHQQQDENGDIKTNLIKV